MNTKEELSVKIAGEIAVSSDPSRTMRKWRELFGITQACLARNLGVSTSVISDYEGGRRPSPGVKTIRKLVNALIKDDESRDSRMIKAYQRMAGGGLMTAVLDMREFASPVKAAELCRAVKGTPVANEDMLNRLLYGYTILDSVKAILNLAYEDFLRLYGMTSERALVFTKVSSGRSPFVAIKVSSMKPGLVILHGLKRVDKLGIKIAEAERIPVVLSGVKREEELIRELRRNRE